MIRAGILGVTLSKFTSGGVVDPLPTRSKTWIRSHVEGGQGTTYIMIS